MAWLWSSPSTHWCVSSSPFKPCPRARRNPNLPASCRRHSLPFLLISLCEKTYQATDPCTTTMAPRPPPHLPAKPNRPPPFRGHRRMRLVVLFLVVKGIEPGSLQSAASSPIPHSGCHTPSPIRPPWPAPGSLTSPSASRLRPRSPEPLLLPYPALCPVVGVDRRFVPQDLTAGAAPATPWCRLRHSQLPCIKAQLRRPPPCPVSAVIVGSVPDLISLRHGCRC
jgi:hypothetical protein